MIVVPFLYVLNPPVGALDANPFRLSLKGAEQLRFPSAWLVFLVLDIVKVVCSIVEHSGDNEGTFPSRGELV